MGKEKKDSKPPGSWYTATRMLWESLWEDQASARPETPATLPIKAPQVPGEWKPAPDSLQKKRAWKKKPRKCWSRKHSARERLVAPFQGAKFFHSGSWHHVNCRNRWLKKLVRSTKCCTNMDNTLRLPNFGGKPQRRDSSLCYSLTSKDYCSNKMRYWGRTL